MSIFNKLTSLFNGNGKPVTEAEQEATNQVAKNPLKIQENAVHIYSHGFSNGVYRVEPDKENFQEFLRASSETEKIMELRKLNERMLLDARQQLVSKKQTSQAVQEKFIERKESVEHLQKGMTEIDEQKSVTQEKQKVLIEQRNTTHAEYGWIPAILYLGAGIVFIVGDISITHQITSWGFDMKGIEGWVFAVGLAFTAFLIKPVVDRLLEKPFQKAGLQMKQVYKTVLLLITVLGITMLFLLGKFRSESQVAATKLGDINYQMQSISDPNSPQYLKLAEERKKINEDLTSNPVGEWGIILSGIIFAIGGALCMSIAFPSLSQLINRYWILPSRIQKLERTIRKMNEQRLAMKNELKITTGDILKAEHQLKGFDFERITNEIKELELEQKRLLVEYYENQFQKEKNLYEDGRNRGEKFDIDGDMVYKSADADPTELYHRNGKSANAGDNNKALKRPFVKIRKLIADNYNKNLNNKSADGSEFEILS
jgi:hypothetical protein